MCSGLISTLVQEYLVDGKQWLDEGHPLVLAVKRSEKRLQGKRSVVQQRLDT
jgi:hypothetical protein